MIWLTDRQMEIVVNRTKKWILNHSNLGGQFEKFACFEKKI